MQWTIEHAPGHGSGQPMMVRRFGAGPEILWIHGLGEWSASFDPVAAHPALAGFSHVLLDLPGYGRSPWPEHPEGLEELADRLAAWIGDRRPALIGHSMGGILAILVAERAAVRALVDIDGALSRSDLTFSAKATAYNLDDFIAHGFSTMRAQVYEDGHIKPALRGYYAALCVASPHVYHRHSHDLIAMSETETLTTRLVALRAPVLFVAGVPGGICAGSRAALDRHGVRWIGLEPAGHWPHLDQLERFATEAAGFLREV